MLLYNAGGFSGTGKRCSRATDLGNRHLARISEVDVARRRPVVLSQSDQAFFERAGGKKWMRGRPFRAGPKQRYVRALGAFAEKLAELGLHPHDPQTLQQLLAVVLDRDGTMGAWFRDHNFPVDDQDDFARLCVAAAGALVADYLHEAEPQEPSPAVLVDTELHRVVTDLLDLAVRVGELSALEGRRAGQGWWDIDGRPDRVDAARADLEALLGSDINVAHRADPDVPDAERQREIAKAALLQLRLTELRRLAKDKEMPELRDAEALAELIARRYESDETKIARLVLQYSVPDVERGWATRLVPLPEPADIDATSTTLQDLRGRYLRLDVATWLVFTHMQTSPNSVSFDGEIRFYSVRPQREGATPELAALQRNHPVSVSLRRGQNWIAVDGGSATDVRRLRAALAHAIGVKANVTLDFSVPAQQGVVALWNPATVRMLHILEHGLRDEHLDYQSFRQAEFARSSILETDPQQVAVQAVRLQGQHVMDDPAACRYITSGHALSSVDIRVRWVPQLGGDAYYTNVRVGLARDHGYVLTAFGEDEKEAHRLHRALVDRLRKALEAPIAADDLATIIGRITTRASESAPPNAVDIWAPTSNEMAAQEVADAEVP